MVLTAGFWAVAVITLIAGTAAVVERGSLGTLLGLAPITAGAAVAPLLFLRGVGVVVDDEYVRTRGRHKQVARAEVSCVLQRSGYGQLLDREGSVLVLLPGVLTKRQLHELAHVLEVPYRKHRR